jgi:hypothetical protein
LCHSQLLGRVFNILRENNPELAGDRRRTVMRPPQVLREGTKKTVFVNFMDLCKTWVDLALLFVFSVSLLLYVFFNAPLLVFGINTDCKLLLGGEISECIGRQTMSWLSYLLSWVPVDPSMDNRGWSLRVDLLPRILKGSFVDISVSS